MTDDLCFECGYVVDYPFCTSQFHRRPKPNPVVDNLKDVLKKVNYAMR